jgi:hypothetical protein
MKCASLVLAALGFLSGLWAAYRWLMASGVEVDFGWRQIGEEGTYKTPFGMMPRHMEPVDEESRQGDVTMGILQAYNESSGLNKSAAIWTAISTALNGLAALAGALS